eukprot:Colp12_sorted_trinity150504_noHs@12462
MDLPELPSEVLIQIFYHLGVKDLLAVGATCSRFHELCYKRDLWASIDLTQCQYAFKHPSFQELMSRVGDDVKAARIPNFAGSKPIVTKQLTQYKEDVVQILLSCKNLERLWLGCDLCPIQQKRVFKTCINLKSVIFSKYALHTMGPGFRQQFGKLRQLSLRLNGFESIETLHRIADLRNLTHLKIKNDRLYFTNDMADVIEPLSQGGARALTHFSLIDKDTTFSVSISHVVKLIENCPSLVHLHLPWLSFGDEMQQISATTMHGLSKLRYLGLAGVSLSEEVEVDHVEATDYLWQLLGMCTHVKHLVFDGERWVPNSADDFLEDYRLWDVCPQLSTLKLYKKVVTTKTGKQRLLSATRSLGYKLAREDYPFLGIGLYACNLTCLALANISDLAFSAIATHVGERLRELKLHYDQPGSCPIGVPLAVAQHCRALELLKTLHVPPPLLTEVLRMCGRLQRVSLTFLRPLGPTDHLALDYFKQVAPRFVLHTPPVTLGESRKSKVMLVSTTAVEPSFSFSL